MAKARYVQIGNAIDYPNKTTADIVYQDVVIMPGCIGVALDTIKAGEVGAVAIAGGSYEFPAAAEEIPIGSLVYWDSTNSAVTATATGNILVGISITEKADAAAGVVTARLCPGTGG